MNQDQVDKAVLLTRELYKFHPCGGLIHIVSDDGNLENSHLLYCWEIVRDEMPEGKAKELAKEILKILAGLGCAERMQYYNMFWGQPELFKPFNIEEARA